MTPAAEFPEAERCACGVVSRGLVDGKCADCRDAEKRHATGTSPAGVYGKYYGLRRTRDDSLVDGWYFVIRERDPHGQEALLAYAASVESENPDLAADLRKHVDDERTMQALYDASWER